MKKALPIFLALIIVISFAGCKKAEKPQETEKKEPVNINGVWVSYVEIDSMINSGDFEGEFRKTVKKCKEFNITDVFFHAVAFCDAYYKTDIYPLRKSNVLPIALKLCHQNGIRFHAWINPYRVKTSDNSTDNLCEGSPPYKWLNDERKENDKNVLTTSSGVYLNPAESQVRETVIEAVRKLCRDIKVDGIHFDDYFYPADCENFDTESYNEYINRTDNPVSLSEYRTSAVNALVSGCYTAIKFINKDIIFSISPAADIVKNKERYFADVSAWCEFGCVDVIIPQLYFGFCYPNEKFCFENLVNEWKNITQNTNTKLCIGLAPYKLGTDKPPDCDEWQNGTDILARQTEICLNDSNIIGQVYYSESSLFSEVEPNLTAGRKLLGLLTE